jgi:hypothetical protein
MGGLQLEKVENTVRRILLNSLQRYATVTGGRGPYSNILLEQNLVNNGFCLSGTCLNTVLSNGRGFMKVY